MRSADQQCKLGDYEEEWKGGIDKQVRGNTSRREKLSQTDDEYIMNKQEEDEKN